MFNVFSITYMYVKLKYVKCTFGVHKLLIGRIRVFFHVQFKTLVDFLLLLSLMWHMSN